MSKTIKNLWQERMEKEENQRIIRFLEKAVFKGWMNENEFQKALKKLEIEKT